MHRYIYTRVWSRVFWMHRRQCGVVHLRSHSSSVYRSKPAPASLMLPATASLRAPPLSWLVYERDEPLLLSSSSSSSSCLLLLLGSLRCHDRDTRSCSSNCDEVDESDKLSLLPHRRPTSSTSSTSSSSACLLRRQGECGEETR